VESAPWIAPELIAATRGRRWSAVVASRRVLHLVVDREHICLEVDFARSNARKTACATMSRGSTGRLIDWCALALALVGGMSSQVPMRLVPAVREDAPRDRPIRPHIGVVTRDTIRIDRPTCAGFRRRLSPSVGSG
jgi:hypothetical protein